jgi:hypothetical protein
MRWSPEEAFTNIFEVVPIDVLLSPVLGRLAHAPHISEEVRAEAEGLLKNEWSFFGKKVVFSDPPNWRANLLTGEEWPDLPVKNIDYRRTDVAGGAKFVWEPGKLSFVSSLAGAYRVTADKRYARKAVSFIVDFVKHNHIDRGIHQTSGIEMAMRNLSWTFSFSLMQPFFSENLDVAEELRGALGLMAQQSAHCWDNLSLGSSGNNHLLAELAGVVTFNAIFGSRQIAVEALRKLQAEVLVQISPDGTSVEQAFGYVPYIWEQLLLPFLAADAAGLNVDAKVRERMAQSLEFGRVARLAAGKLPAIGDEDDGRILFPADGPTRLHLIGNALAGYLGSAALTETAQEYALTFSQEPLREKSVEAGNYEYPTGGYTIWRFGDTVATFDHGPLGWRLIAAHAHADGLSITLTKGMDSIILDSGTFAYHELSEDRDRFRSTPYHSTVNFGGRSQSEMLGPFLWGDRAEISKDGDGFLCKWITGERHWRKVTFDGEILEIIDQVHGDDAEIVFVLDPGAKVELSEFEAKVCVGSVVAHFSLEGTGPLEIKPGEISTRYANRTPTKRLCAPIIGGRAITKVALQPAGAENCS